MSKLFTQPGFVADDVFTYRDPKDGTLQRVPVRHLRVGENLKLGESVAKMKKPIQTKDSASRDDEVARALRRLERVTDELEQRLVLLERPHVGQRKFTVDHNAPPEAPNSYESVLRHFRTLPARQTQEAKDFEVAARRHHRKESVRPEEQPAGAVRTADAVEDPDVEWARKHRAAGAAQRAAQGKKKL